MYSRIELSSHPSQSPQPHIHQHAKDNRYLPSPTPYPLLPKRPQQTSNWPKEAHGSPPYHIVQLACSTLLIAYSCSRSRLAHRVAALAVVQPLVLHVAQRVGTRHRLWCVRVRLDGEKLQPQVLDFQGREAGVEKAVEAAGDGHS